LVGTEEEKLVLQDGTAESAAKNVAVKGLTWNPGRVEEERVGVETGGLVVLVGSAVKIVGAGLGQNGNVRAAVAP
jgi:hypothetical protein